MPRIQDTASPSSLLFDQNFIWTHVCFSVMSLVVHQWPPEEINQVSGCSLSILGDGQNVEIIALLVTDGNLQIG